MGCDLITYMLVAPDKFSEEAVHKARNYASQLREEIQAAVTLMEKENLNFVDLPEEQFKLLSLVTDDYFSGMTIDADELRSLREELSDDRISELIDFLDSPDTRDCNYRYATIGGQTVKIIVAGDQTWGDSPDGSGYQQCDFMFKMGLDKVLGIE